MSTLFLLAAVSADNLVPIWSIKVKLSEVPATRRNECDCANAPSVYVGYKYVYFVQTFEEP